MLIGDLFKPLHDDAAWHERAHEVIDLVGNDLRHRPTVIGSLARLNPASHDKPIAHANFVAQRLRQSTIRNHSDLIGQQAIFRLRLIVVALHPDQHAQEGNAITSIVIVMMCRNEIEIWAVGHFATQMHLVVRWHTFVFTTRVSMETL